MIRTGDIDPAYLIFARFQQRNRERIQHAIALLSTEPDWTVNESFDFDRSKAPWPATRPTLDELWRKRVKNDALSLHADRQELAGGRRCRSRSATSACSSASTR